ncbi:MAG: hypothetical protein WC802_02175 [Patescibacteria group bacterium]
MIKVILPSADEISDRRIAVRKEGQVAVSLPEYSIIKSTQTGRTKQSAFRFAGQTKTREDRV